MVVLSEHDVLEVFLSFILLYQRLYCSAVLSDRVMVKLCNPPSLMFWCTLQTSYDTMFAVIIWVDDNN